MKQIITGRSGSGKSAYIIEKIKEDLKAGYDNIIVIVPDQFTFETERELIRETGKGLFQIRILSFHRLIQTLREELGTGGCNTLDETSKAMFVNKLLYDYNLELGVYDGAYNTPAFSFDMAKVITECKQFGVDFGQLEGVKIGGKTGEKLKDITTVYKAYTGFKNEFKDNEDIINLITDRISKSQLLKGARIYIDHFDVFTFQGYNIIEQMAKVCSSLCVCVCSDGSEKGLFALTSQTVKKLKERVPDMETVSLLGEYKKNNISHLEKHLFDRGSEFEKIKADGSVELFSFANALSEIDHAAAKVIELKNTGYNYKDICVMTGDIESYAVPVEQVFNHCGIPCFLDKKTSLISFSTAKFVVYSLRYAVFGSQRDFMGMIKQGFFIRDKEDIQKIENYILAHGLNRFLKPVKGDEYIKRLSESITSKTLSESFLDAKTVSSMARAVIEYLYSFETELKDETEERCFNALIEILERAASIFGETEIDHELFVKIIETGIISKTLGTIPDKEDRVLIGDISRTKIEKAKCLLVLGISDGVIPKITQKDGLLSDYDMSKLGVKMGRDSVDLNSLERLLTYKMFGKPTDYLYLSHSDRDIYGYEHKNEAMFNRVQSMIDVKVNYDVPFNEDINMRILKSKELAFKQCVSNVFAGENDRITRGVLYYFKDNGINELFKPKSLDLSITKEQAAKVYGDASISATRIETYYKCAFMHFIKYGIRPKERELYKIDRLNTGVLLHSVIDEFSKYIISATEEFRNGGKTKEQLYETIVGGIQDKGMVDKIVKERLKEDGFEIYGEDNIGKTMSLRITNMCKSALMGVANELKDSDFVMTYSEKDLCEFGEYKLLGMELKGRVDRIDVSDDGIRIVDYKTSNTKIDYKDVYAGVKLQLLIYMGKLMHYYRERLNKNMLPLSVEYFRINQAYKKQNDVEKLKKSASAPEKSEISSTDKNISQKDMDILTRFGMQRAKEAAERIYDGDIAIRPYRADYNRIECDYCPYMDICKNKAGENRRMVSKVKLEDIINEYR